MIVSEFLQAFPFETDVVLVDVKQNKLYFVDTERYYDKRVSKWDGEVRCTRIVDGKIAVFYKSGIGL